MKWFTMTNHDGSITHEIAAPYIHVKVTEYPNHVTARFVAGAGTRELPVLPNCTPLAVVKREALREAIRTLRSIAVQFESVIADG